MLDCVIRGDRIVTPWGTVAGQVAVRDRRIVGILSPGEVVSARRVIEAEGLAVLPGAVDIHTHLRDPGYTHKEDFATGTAAAAAGGWTTVIAQPNTNPPLVTVAAFREAVAIGTARSNVDFGVAAMAVPGNVAELPLLRAEGAVLFEAAMCDVPNEWLVGTLAELAAILLAAKSTGTLVALYANDHTLVNWCTQALQAAGRVDPLAPGEGRPGYAEAAAIAAAAELAGGLEADLHIRQISTAAGIAALRRAKSGARGHLTAEVNPHHLFLTSQDSLQLGPFSRVIPPLRESSDRDQLWAALHDGTVDLISTDHAPHTPEEKLAGANDIWKAASGMTVLETALPLLLDRVATGGLTLEAVARWTAEQPARRVGLYPRKGAIAPGADADLVLAELGPPWQVDPARFQGRSRWSPFAGTTLCARIQMTMVGGQAVYEQGQMAAEGAGRNVRPAER